MASSSKVVFHLETLQANALESLDERIKGKRAELGRLGSDEAVADRKATWRTTQEKRLRDLVKDLKTVPDRQLSAFKIEAMPEVDSFERTRVAKELERLEVIRSKMVAKASSLMPEPDGSCALTKTQLAEFFDL